MNKAFSESLDLRHIPFLLNDYSPTTAVNVCSTLSMTILTYRNTFKFDSVKHVI